MPTASACREGCAAWPRPVRCVLPALLASAWGCWVHSASPPACLWGGGVLIWGDGGGSQRDTKAGVLVPRSAAVHCWQQ